MAAVGPGTKRLIREINEALVLDVLRVHREVARSEIARKTGLSPPTVTGITARLLEVGLITEVSSGQSTGGRPPKILALRPEGGHVIGVWLNTERVAAVTVNLVGEIVDTESVSWTGKSPTAAERAVTKAVRALAARSPSTVMGVGVTVSGVVDYATGTVRHSGLLGWEDVPFGANLSARLRLPVTVDKLVNGLAASLVLFGAGRNVNDMMVVSVGQSIGLGLVVDGLVRRGLSGPTGSLGHTSISVLGSDDDKLCHCGARGCLETVASERALRAELERAGWTDVDEAARRADDNEKVQRIFATAGRALGGAVANVAKVLNPELVVIGGESTRLGPPLLEPVTKELRMALSGATERDVDVRTVWTDDQAWARGAACQALAQLFQVSRPPAAAQPADSA